jgi:hypothetical protein
MHVFTSRFRIQRQFWHFANVTLPFPLTVWPFVIAFLAFFVQLQFVLRFYTMVLPFPLNVSLMAGVAIGVYKLADRPQVAGMPLMTWLQLNLTWLFEPRVMVGELERVTERGRVRERLSCWSPILRPPPPPTGSPSK